MGSAISKAGRIELLDILRGVALIAMAIYHFAWDLEFFGYAARGMTAEIGWKLFARSIASSFLVLVGIGLVLAHLHSIRWRSFSIRLAQVAAGAAAITIATFFATPNGFVFFGILHQIVLASVLGLVFLRSPWWLTAAIGIGVIMLPFAVETAATNSKWLAWIGMAERSPVSNDYVPVFPWFGAVLFGIAIGRLGTELDLWARLRTLNVRLRPLSALGWLGRHSLLFYLLHQPVLAGLVWTATQVAPPDPAIVFRASCRKECGTSFDASTCHAFCGCAETAFRSADLLQSYVAGLTTADEIASVRAACAFTIPESPPQSPDE